MSDSPASVPRRNRCALDATSSGREAQPRSHPRANLAPMDDTLLTLSDEDLKAFLKLGFAFGGLAAALSDTFDDCALLIRRYGFTAQGRCQPFRLELPEVGSCQSGRRSAASVSVPVPSVRAGPRPAHTRLARP